MINKRSVREFLIITVGTAIIAAAVYFFMLPSNLTVGSASALALVISNFVPLPVSVITFCLNIVLLIIGFILIGPEFGAKTVYASILLPVIMRVYEVFFPDFQSFTEDAFLDMILYILSSLPLSHTMISSVMSNPFSARYFASISGCVIG